MSQVDIDLQSLNTKESDSWYSLNVMNRSQKSLSVIVSIQATRDGKIIYEARSKNVLLNPGLSLWSN